MNYFFKLFITLLLVVITIFALYLALQKGYLNNQIRVVITYYLNHKQINANIKDLEFKKNILKIGQINIPLNNEDDLVLSDIDLHLNLGIFTKASINNTNIIFLSKNQKLFKTKIQGNFDITLTGALKTYELKTTNENSNINLDISKSKEGLVRFVFNTKETPLSLYRLLIKFFPENTAVTYCAEHLTKGYIKEGNLEITMDQDTHVQGSFVLEDLRFEYHPLLPALEHVNTNITIAESNIILNLEKAYISDTPIKNGIVNINYKDLDNIFIKVSGTAEGDVKNLINFIPDKNLSELKIQNIDLTKIKGKSKTNIDITIPCKKNTENIYNITTESSNLALLIFQDNIALSNAKIKGIYNGKAIKIQGQCKINNFESNIDLNYDFAHNTSPGRFELTIQGNIVGNNQKLDLIRLIHGTALVNFEYSKIEDQKPQINLTSDLKNLEFLIDKIFINKYQYHRAFLKINNNSEDVDYNLYLKHLYYDTNNSIFDRKCGTKTSARVHMIWT